MPIQIGRGARACIYAEGSYAVKVFSPGYPRTDVFYEALINTLIEPTGLPVARVHGVCERSDGLAIIMDLLPGITMSQAAAQQPERLPELAAELAALQRQVHAPRVALPFSLLERLASKVKSAEALSPAQQAAALALLAELPAGDSLCHGDFHGNNILVDGERHYIVDWVDATTGCPEGDACRSYLLTLLGAPGAAEIYLQTYCAQAGVDRAAVLRWLPVVAAARASETIAGQQDRLAALLAELLPG